MTGFARAASSVSGGCWTWEARSVNGRGLDLRVRLPAGLDRLDHQARAAAQRRFQRGSLSLQLSLEPEGGPGEVTVDRARLEAWLARGAELRARHGLAPARTDGILALRGVVESRERTGAEVDEALDAPILASLDGALAGLAAARAEEGARIAPVLLGLLAEIEALASSARGLAALQPGALRARMLQQLAEFGAAVPPLSQERLAQEVALLASKADVCEELDRLGAHVAQARALLGGEAQCGRKLEFLAQEFNREANTLCSKSSDLELTRCGLELKAAIDRLREQSANIE
ncbi:MAG: YicC/YloC family endoribonuclease [Alphaproteobacteria bacterium]